MEQTFSFRIIYFDYYLIKFKDKNNMIDPSAGKFRMKNNSHFEDIKCLLCKRDLVFNEFMQREVELAPVVRIFGTTYRGQKCCLNVHNYFPYFYIEINRDNYFPIDKIECLRDLAFTVEKVYLRYIAEKEKEKDNQQAQVVHKIEVIEKYKFYGYSKEKTQFLKIYVYDPKSIKILMEIFHSCIIRGRHFQCYEAHISYSMHFFADYNLYGMGMIKFINFSFRYDIPDKNVCGDNACLVQSNIVWDEGVNISKNNIINYEEDTDCNYLDFYENLQIWDHFRLFNQGRRVIFNNLKKSSKSPIELDVDVADILKKKCDKVQNFSSLDNSILDGENVGSSLIFSNMNNFNNLNNMHNMNNMNNFSFQNIHTHLEANTNINLNLNTHSDNLDITNLNKHIKYTKTLIELWEDEISRREELNMEDLRIEKISNQNYFSLVQDLILKSPELSDTLIQNNTKSLQFNLTNELLEELELECLNFDFYINEERFKFLVGKKNKLCLKSWFNFKRGNFFSLGKGNKNLGSLTNSNSKSNKTNDMMDNDNFNETDDVDDILSSISELSLPNQTRNKLREIMTTRSIEEYFTKSDEDSKSFAKQSEEIKICKSETKAQLDNRYSLLKIHHSKHFNENKLRENFINLFRNFYSFRRMFPTKENLLYRLIMNRDFTYNLKINKYLSCLYYSEMKDYIRFITSSNKKPLQINKARSNLNGLVMSHTSLSFFLQSYNKVVKPLKEIRSKSICKRKEKIEELLEKERKVNEESSSCSPLSCLRVLGYADLIFIGKGNNTNDVSVFPAPTKMEIISKIEKRKNKRNLMKILNSEYFKMKYSINKKIVNQDTNVNLFLPQNDNFPFTEINDKTYLNLNYTYNNEISPGTGKKCNNSFLPILNNNPNINSHPIRDLLKNLELISNLTLFSIELLCEGRDNNTWFHERDAILSIFCSVHDENAKLNHNLNHNLNQNVKSSLYSPYKFIITTHSNKNITRRLNYNNMIIAPEFSGFKNEAIDFENITEVFYTKDEYSLIMKFIELFCKYDPDLVIGYETEILSIAYITRRGEFLGIPVKSLISRLNSSELMNNLNEQYIKENFRKRQNERLVNSVNVNNAAESSDHKDIKYLEQKFGKIVKVRGRVIVNLWRLLECDLKLTNYKLENVVFNVLKIREPQFNQQFLLDAYKSDDPRKIVFTLDFYSKRANYNLLILDELDLINRDVQFTKIYGIDFESSLTRGSQYRVEGVLCRVTKANDYLLLSASRDQLNHQEPPNCTPLVREPPKNIFYSPVVILDFQSLYPSIIIAYNICYSTCLGKLLDEDIEKVRSNYKEDYLMFNENCKKFGVYRIDKNILELLKNDIPPDIVNDRNKLIDFIKENCTISTNHTLFVKKNIREGILPIILRELLMTRIMIKNSCRKYDKKSLIYKMLNNRQLGLKLLANVTYGYTAAGFSGRMPSSEVGDSIVAIAKETLLKAIRTVESTKEWNAKVIYGDTDSMFVLLEGRSPEQAIQLGKLIAEVITKANPEPIKLQFEKIYCPMVMLSKKHYAGYKYEDINSVKNNEKEMESKGIETVRRDTCEAVCKVMDKTIKILFETKDLSLLKTYLYRTFDKILTGRAIIKDFIFAKEVRLGTYRGSNLPPSAQVAFEKHLRDPNYFPRFKEREPYLVVSNPNNSKRLKDCIVSPEDFFTNKNAFLNTTYYIEKQILPAVGRILEPINVDIFDWYSKYPRPCRNKHNLYFKNTSSNIEGHHHMVVSKNKNSFLTSKYKLVDSNNNSKTIDDFFNTKETNTDKSAGCKKGNMSHISHISYRQKVEALLQLDHTCSSREERLKLLTKTLREEHRLKKLKEFKKICRVCSHFDKFNFLLEEVPCRFYMCKIFYEKLLLENKKN